MLYYAAAMDSRLLQKPGIPLTIYDIGALVDIAFKRSMTPSNITSGFKRTGIFPFDDKVFDDSDFAPSAVTDRPCPKAVLPDVVPTTATDQPCPEPVRPGMNPEAGPSHENGNLTSSGFKSPQEIRGYPIAAPRKETGKGRKRGRSMIATDTPEKEALAQSRPQNKHFTQNQHAKDKSRQPITKKLVFDEDSSSEDDLILSDHSSDDFDEISNEDQAFPALEVEPKVNDYVLAEFEGRPTLMKYYVGLITKEKDDEGDYEVSYLRRKRTSMEFFFPQVQDIASVKLSDIKAILPKPNTCGTTRRQNSYIKFDFNFGIRNIN